jgi:hypothetical protein
MAGTVSPATPASIVLREIIRASVDEARSKRNAARRSFHNLAGISGRQVGRQANTEPGEPAAQGWQGGQGDAARATDGKVCYFGPFILLVIK